MISIKQSIRTCLSGFFPSEEPKFVYIKPSPDTGEITPWTGELHEGEKRNLVILLTLDAFIAVPLHVHPKKTKVYTWEDGSVRVLILGQKEDWTVICLENEGDKIIIPPEAIHTVYTKDGGAIKVSNSEEDSAFFEEGYKDLIASTTKK